MTRDEFMDKLERELAARRWPLGWWGSAASAMTVSALTAGALEYWHAWGWFQ